jgi:RNA polymerase-binding transcription factor DksA
MAAARAADRRAAAARVADLERELAAIAESTAAGPDDEHDAEGSTVGYERARVGSLLTAARRHLSAVDDALARAASGCFGRCVRCGAAIGQERLRALPAAARCVHCASEP